MARDPSIDWSEKKKVMDSIFQRRASTGRQLHELEKQSQALSTTILAKQQQVCERWTPNLPCALPRLQRRANLNPASAADATPLSRDDGSMLFLPQPHSSGEAAD